MIDNQRKILAGSISLFAYRSWPPERIADAILSDLATKGLVLVPEKATRAMTIKAEKMGAGEAWAEDCWSAMIEASGE